MGKLGMNIQHGNLNVRIRHGGGFDPGGLIQVAVLAGAAVGAAVIIVEFAWLIITVGVLAVAARLWLLHRRNVAIAVIAARGELIRAEQRAREAAALTAQRAHEIDVARAGAQPIHIHNVIDPAPFVAAALTALGVQPQPVTIRGEVER